MHDTVIIGRRRGRRPERYQVIVQIHARKLIVVDIDRVALRIIEGVVGAASPAVAFVNTAVTKSKVSRLANAREGHHEDEQEAPAGNGEGRHAASATPPHDRASGGATPPVATSKAGVTVAYLSGFFTASGPGAAPFRLAWPATALSEVAALVMAAAAAAWAAVAAATSVSRR